MWGWAFTMLCEELRQIVTSVGRTTMMKLRFWFASLWNRFDLVMFLTVIAIVNLRLLVKQD
ncbi:hypothetical protein DPMN_099171 [Dreissena polymorpha]|uniref:Ion transport domain-containing protein n=1 Tax=Dreissena polymorpha TaxID=45954 RepID=A0A9D4LDK1_DREPO|nr:hypothetical protein DPMN_099171 [Dreissena polymorpha]